MTREEAIEIIKNRFDKCALDDKDTEAIQTLIPELAESEDERIRKAIRLVLIATEEDQELFYRTHNLTRKECTDWLEKQKEQNPVEIHIDNPNIQKVDPNVKITTSDSSAGGKELLYVCNKSYDIGFRDGVASVKPAKWSDEDNIGWDEAFACVTRAEKAAKNEEELQNAVTAEEWLKEIKFKYYVHPVKQEWSEEDENMLDNILRVLSCFTGTAECESDPSLSTSYPLYMKEMDWLKSLTVNLKKKNEDVAKLCSNEWGEEDENTMNDLISLLWILQGSTNLIEGTASKYTNWLKSLRPQPKVEWNEEDEEMITRICANLEYLVKEAGCDSELKDKLEERIKWMKRLKSIRPRHLGMKEQWCCNAAWAAVRDSDTYNEEEKQFSLDFLQRCEPQPHWKPGEEHIGALQAIINDPNNAGSESCQLALKSLLDRLKKL